MFQPKYGNGEKVKLPWQLSVFKISCCWPLKDGAQKVFVVGQRICLLFLLIFFVFTIFSEYFFIFEHRREITLVTECLCTTLIGNEIFLRIIHLNVRSKTMRKLLDNFYRKVVLDREKNKEQEKKLKRSLVPTVLLSYGYITTATIILCSPIISLIMDPHSNNKPYPYRMKFLYDAQKPVAYGITISMTTYVGLSCVCTMVAENYEISFMLCHCAARYEMLHTKLETLFFTVKSGLRLEYAIHKNFVNSLRNIVRKHQELDDFAKDLENFFTIPLFLIFTVGMFLMCVIAFQLATFGLNVGTIQYITWLISTLIELYVLGGSGQKFTDASEKLSKKYYMSNWEDLLSIGSQKMNADLMKDLSFAILRSQKPLELTGLKFIKLSLITTERAISTSLSYFMFLITMRDRS